MEENGKVTSSLMTLLPEAPPLRLPRSRTSSTLAGLLHVLILFAVVFVVVSCSSASLYQTLAVCGFIHLKLGVLTPVI